MKKFLSWFKGSFEINSTGASARKMCAFAITMMVVITHIKWFKSEHWEYLSIVLGMDFTFILVCLGLATWQYMKKPEEKDETLE